MSLRSPLSKVLGSGTARDGVSHWWLQRLTAIALVPLTLWFVISLLLLGTLDYDVISAWLTRPFNAFAMFLLVAVLAGHSHLGVQVVVEDYVHGHGLKFVTLVLAGFLHLLVGAGAAFAILKLAFGGAA